MITRGGLHTAVQPQTPGRLWPLLCLLFWSSRRFRLLAIGAECGVCKTFERSHGIDAHPEGAFKTQAKWCGKNVKCQSMASDLLGSPQ